MSVVLGIDPGSRLTGYGVLDISSCSPQVLAWGVLEPPSKTSFDRKLGFLLTKLESLFQNWHPQVMVLEKSFLGKSVPYSLSTRTSKRGFYGRSRFKRNSSGGVCSS